MDKDKLLKAIKYLDLLKDKMGSSTPKKHLSRPDTYKLFLEKEISATQKKIDALKLEGYK
jgi:hypothetical protein